MQERRTSRRLARSEKTTVKTDSRTDHPVELIDISTGGMRLYSLNEMPLGCAVNSQLKISPQIGGFHIQGRVTWCKPAQGGKGYEVGVTFTKVHTKPF